MKEKPYVSKHARKTLHAFIEKEYGADADTVWRNTIRKYKSFVKNSPDYGGRKSWRTEQEIRQLNYCRGLQKGWIWF